MNIVIYKSINCIKLSEYFNYYSIIGGHYSQKKSSRAANIYCCMHLLTLCTCQSLYTNTIFPIGSIPGVSTRGRGKGGNVQKLVKLVSKIKKINDKKESF